MRILIVEDSDAKALAICEVVRGAIKAKEDDLVLVPDIIAAKRELKSTQFDALVLDIQVPMRFGEQPVPNGGIRLLEEIGGSQLYRMPRSVVGITEFSDSYLESKHVFHEYVSAVIQYSQSGVEWIDQLTQFLLVAQQRANNESECDLLVICALNDPELEAVRTWPVEWQVVEDSSDTMIAYKASVPTPRGNFNVFAACTLEMGMAASAVLTARLIERHKPRYVSMCGIAGGVKGEVDFGDVVLADVVWDYSSGKLQTSNTGSIFQPDPKVILLDAFVRRQCLLALGDPQLTVRIQQRWTGLPVAHSLKAHLGPMFSGPLVVSSQDKVSEFSDTHRKLKAIEMEAYAVFCAAKYASHPQPKAIVIKSISDFADVDKDDAWRKYASFTSAQFLYEWACRFV